jgi:hypothetical protein
MGVAAITIILTNYFTHSGWLFWGITIARAPDQPVGCQGLEVLRAGPAATRPPGGAGVAGKVPAADIRGEHKVPSVTFSEKGLTRLLRMLNVSGDDVLDVVIGFGTGADGWGLSSLL